MLMDDDRELCEVCAAEQAGTSGRSRHAPEQLRAGVGDAHEASPHEASPHEARPHEGGIAVLERPVDPLYAPGARYRTRSGAGRRVMVVVALVLGGFAVLVALALRGQGPLAEQVVDVGLVGAPVVSVPGAWVTASSERGGFSAAMPAGVQRLEVPFDPADPTAGALHGYRTQLGEGGSTQVVGWDLGGRPELVRSATDDPAAFSALVDWMVASMSTATATETVRRDVPVGNGRAVDLVVVDEAEGVTTRARYHLAGGHLLGVVTSGLDEGADRLDEVHARVLDSFRPLD
jgi:hypothetical protein